MALHFESRYSRYGASRCAFAFHVSSRLQVVERITYCFPRAISQGLRVFYNSATSHLEKLLAPHQTYYVATDGPTPPGSSDDSGETTLLPQLGSAILDFIKSATRTKAMKEWVLADEKEGGSQVIAPLLSLVIAWAQMTSEDVSLRCFTCRLYLTIFYRRLSGLQIPMHF